MEANENTVKLEHLGTAGERRAFALGLDAGRKCEPGKVDEDFPLWMRSFTGRVVPMNGPERRAERRAWEGGYLRGRDERYAVARLLRALRIAFCGA